MTHPPKLWQANPEFQRSSNMWQFLQWCREVHGLPLETYEELWQWSVEQLESFWQSIWTYYDLPTPAASTRVLQRPADGMIGCSWFEGEQLNYAEQLFRQANDTHPAMLFQSERQPLQEISWAELRQTVARVAAYLKAKGVQPGDRVVSFMPNIPQAVIAFLATASLGAVWSSCSPDFGVTSVVDRFQQIKPKILFAADGYAYNGKAYPRRSETEQLLQALPSIEGVVFLRYLQPDAPLPTWDPLIAWEALPEASEPLSFTPVAFSDPLWVLYSSGTTGKPKAITHSVGGCLLEHLKALGLHHNCQPGDRFFWYSTTGWMMWNYSVASMLVGATLVLYDGAAGYPDLQILWKFAEAARITHFGGGAAFFIACMKADLPVKDQCDLSSLLSIGSTGSPLPANAFQWLYEAVKSDHWLVSLSGGTDVCSGFVGGSPLLPVYAGEIQCRMLGCKLEAYNESGQAVIGEVGEMVITEPMPSMPIYFWNDTANRRYRESYFDMYPGVWRHGDWLKITQRGTLVIYGRSDATLNRAGVRIGTSEVYTCVEQQAAIKDSLVVSLERPDGSYYMPLFVQMQPGESLDEALKQTIKGALRSQHSPRHVPDDIFEAPLIPYTMSGKKMETPVKKILMGTPPSSALSKDAMKNPGSLDFFVSFAQTLTDD